MTEQNKFGPDKTADTVLVDEAMEERINALLEGELDSQQAEQLKSEASADQKLASAIIEAYQLQAAMDTIGEEQAPASLRRKLKAIPRQHRPAYFQPRWVMAFALVPLMVISVALFGPREPSTMEVEQARQELAVAFAYLDQINNRSSLIISSELSDEMSNAVAGSIFKTIQQQKVL